jgi:hypothetical protein
MQNKFESELANRIAEKGRLWSPRQLGVLVAAIAACALIVGASALSLPITASGSDNCPITFEPLLEQKTDYLVSDGAALTYADVWDSTYDVVRTVNLRSATFDTGAIHTKWTYTTHVKLQDVSMLVTVDGQIAAVHLSTLTIYGVNEATLNLDPVQYSITLGGVPMEGLNLASYAVADLDDGTTMTIDITLPPYAYVDGAEIVILVQYKADMLWNSLSNGFDEIGFPEF